MLNAYPRTWYLPKRDRKNADSSDQRIRDGWYTMDDLNHALTLNLCLPATARSRPAGQ